MHKFLFTTLTMLASLGLLACTGRADTVRMTNGTSYAGNIVSESDTEVQIEVPLASGTIFRTETLRKSEVAEISRPTPAQRAEEEMQAAYKKTLPYQLDPQTSQPLNYYNQILNDVFQAFLTKYPGSPYEKELNDRISKWTEERDKVATGMRRIGSDWMPMQEYDKRMEDTRAQMLLEKGRQLASHSEFSKALELFRGVLGVSHRPALVDEARRSYGEVGKMWGEALERQKDAMTAEIKTTDDAVQHFRQEYKQAASVLAETERQPPPDGDVHRIGQDSVVARYRLEASTLADEYKTADTHLSDLRLQLIALQNRINEVKTMTAAASTLMAAGEAPQPPKPAIIVTAAPPAVVTPPVDQTPDSPDVLVQVANFFKAYWIYGLVGFVIIAWAGTRVFTK